MQFIKIVHKVLHAYSLTPSICATGPSQPPLKGTLACSCILTSSHTFYAMIPRDCPQPRASGGGGDLQIEMYGK